MSPRRFDLQPVSAHTRSPRLVLLFSILTALAVAAAAAVILVLLRATDGAQARVHATERARFAAQSVLAPALRASDLRAPLSGGRERTLTRLLKARVLGNGVQSVALYGAPGRMTYAIGPPVDRTQSSAQLLHEIFAGAPTVSETVRAPDGSPVLRTYVPVAEMAGRVQAVAVVEQTYGAGAAPGHRSLAVVSVLEALLAILFLALVPVLARASARIESHVVELEHVARHDELTTLPNRQGIAEAIEAVVSSSETAVVALVDLDGFSELNASLGTECGDRVLIEVAERLVLELSPLGASVGRSGDDEFCVVAPDMDATGASWLEHRIRRAFSAPFVVDGVRMAVDIDVGVALYPDHGVDVEAVLGCAAAALVHAKQESRSATHLYDPEIAVSRRCRLTVAAELRAALAARQLSVHYQPQLDLQTYRIRGVEALVRWNHPDRGLLTAGEFIAHVERSGLSQELRRHVLGTAAPQWQEWHKLGVSLDLAVNIDAVDMLDPTLPDEIAHVLERHGVPPENLVLEFTERTLVGDERRAHQVVEKLQRIGVRLSVDDFGTGYSSLAALRAFALHEVKLDKSLLADVPGDEAAESIVGGSVEIAHGLGALIVAEGVETPEQLHFASAVGCDIAQGYLVGAPVPGAEIPKRVNALRVVPLSVAR